MRKVFFLLLLVPIISIGQRKLLTLDDIYKKQLLTTETVRGFNSMKDGRYYTEIDKDGNLLKKLFITGETVEILVGNNDVKDEKGNILALKDYVWSEDEQRLLIAKNREFIYRRSSKATVYSYDIASKATTLIDADKILHATYSPDGSKVAYVKDNNLFYKELNTGKTMQVTKDGKKNNIINGSCDWVYEEEFGFTKAFQWSPKSNYLAYYRFDETNVPTYTMTVYDSLYPTPYTYKYPKAGEVNSLIEIYVYDITKRKSVKADLGKETDIYIPRIKWTLNNESLAVTWLNRLQNEMMLLSIEATTGKAGLLYKEESNYYIDAEIGNVIFLQDEKHFAFISERDGYSHIYLQEIGGEKPPLELTKGKYDVDRILGIDEKTNVIYFTAAYKSPMSREFCSVNLTGTHFKVIDERIGTHSISMNADYTYYMDSYSTITSPPIISIYDITGKNIRILKDNSKLVATVKEYSLGIPEFFNFKTSKGESLNGWMLKPLDFDATKKYPVLFCNYGGPGSQKVTDSWNAVSGWQQLLAQKGYIIACVDNTGTGFRGEEFKKKTYLQLGKLEIEDQIDAGKYVSTLTYVDGKRIGHWGWSFGGFMSSLAITKGADVFKTAIAVAPVTNWRFYDNIYTERYMRTPKENAKGYDDNAPLNFVDKIKGKFLIIHGTADDNVHFQNSVMMVDEMIKKNIEFESGYYPNKNHGINGGNTTYHIYNKMTKFILENL